MNFKCYGLGNTTEEILTPGGIYAVIMKALPAVKEPIFEIFEIPGKKVTEILIFYIYCNFPEISMQKIIISYPLL